MASTLDHSQFKKYAKIRDYDWSGNAEFQGGLRAILASAPPEQVDVLTNRAKCFYFQKKTQVPVNDKEYLAWLATTSAPAEAAKEEAAPKEKAEWVQAAESAAGEEVRGSGVVDDAPYPTSFADIVELIIAGKPIPGIKEIPDVVLEAPAETEETKVAARKKPWET